MDEELEAIERLHGQRPEDVEVAARLKAALLRAGRRDALRERYARAFACSQAWRSMAERSPGVRACGACGREVHVALGPGDLPRLAAKGACLALPPQRLLPVLDALIDGPHPGPVRRPEDPCLVTAPLPPPPQAAVYGAPPAPRPVYGAPPPRR